MAKHTSSARRNATDEEYQRFSEQFVELIIDPRQEWMIEFLLAGGFGQVPEESKIDSGDFALSVLNRIGRDWLAPAWLVDALTAGDREKLVPYIKRRTVAANLTPEHMAILLEMGTSSALRRSLKRLTARLGFHRGTKPKLPARDYSKILEKSEVLQPAIEKVLNELMVSSTGHTLSEILQYWERDHPKACKFLLDHIQQFQKALNDKRLFQRARKRVSARARVLADALAGTEFNLTFSTSLERVRQARRAKSPDSP